MGAIWSPIPTRLMDDDDYLELDEAAALLLLQLYILCDGYGLAPAGPRWLGRRTSVSDPAKAIKALEDRFVRLYEADGKPYASIKRYDHDLNAQFKRKRGRPKYPQPPWPGSWDVPEDGADQGQTKGRPTADQGQTKGRPTAADREKERKKERKRDKSAAVIADPLSLEGYDVE
jgi:hypothetical protein